MRHGLLISWTVVAADADVGRCDLRTVWSGYDRDFWFVFTSSTVSCYATKADALAATNKLAGATGITWTGAPQTVILTTSGGSFDPTPLTIEVFVIVPPSGFGSVLVAWSANPEQLLLERMQEILLAYMSTNEVLNGLGFTSVNQVRLNPRDEPRLFPLIELLLTETVVEPQDAPSFEVRIGVTVRGYVKAATIEAANALAAELHGVLRAIVFDAQRTWGGFGAGFAQDTVALQAPRPSVAEQTDGFVVYADLPASIWLKDARAFRETSSGQPGSGGKYARAAAAP